MACTTAIVLAVVLGVPLGWSFRGRELDAQVLNSTWTGRVVSHCCFLHVFRARYWVCWTETGSVQLAMELLLVSADASAGTASFRWFIVGDSCINSNNATTITEELCPLVNIYMDQ